MLKYFHRLFHKIWIDFDEAPFAFQVLLTWNSNSISSPAFISGKKKHSSLPGNFIPNWEMRTTKNMDFDRKPAGTDTLICLCCDFEKEVAMLISANRKTFIVILCVRFWKNQTFIRRYFLLLLFLRKKSKITLHNQG